jgi:hypothetical protein
MVEIALQEDPQVQVHGMTRVVPLVLEVLSGTRKHHIVSEVSQNDTGRSGISGILLPVGRGKYLSTVLNVSE